jgi:hypothetical protein
MVQYEKRSLNTQKTMLSFLVDQKFDEVDYIQKESFQFFLKICRQYFPNNFQENITLVKKGPDSGPQGISYSTILRNNVDELTKVKGECDSTLLYGLIPVACWEDKNLTKTLTTPSEIGQAFAEVKGTSEIFKNSIRLTAPRFTGVLTSGLVWSLTIKEFRDGADLYTRTTPIETVKNGTISNENVDIVASLLIYHLETIQVLMEMIDEYHHSLHKKPATFVSDFPQDDHSQGDDDDDDDQGDNVGPPADQENGVTTRLQILSLSSASRGHAQNKENKSSGAGQKRNVLQVLSQNVKLSPENLLVHNTLNTRAFV